MKIVKTNWDHPEIEVSPSLPMVVDDDQPGFGVQVLWNTSNILKPCLIIWFWTWRIQVGWLAG